MKKLLSILIIVCLIFSSSTFALVSEPSSWAEESINELKEYNEFDSDAFERFKENITRKEFIYFAVRIYELFDGKEITPDPSIFFNDTDDIYALKGATVGITSGIGNNNFGPDELLTREQLAVLMMNTIKLGNLEMNSSSMYKFNDESNFSSWALESIYLAKANDIINGVGNDLFNPKGNATIEVAIIITNKIVKNNKGKEWTSKNGESHTISIVKEDTNIEFDGYKLLNVDGGDLSGTRESNVVVDIGYGDREYYAFTNEYGQLVKVTAKEIIPQDESTEPVLSTGRYYSDEAKVPGTESPNLDEGHVIADSLGGVANAYNITPQNSTLNRHGDQAYMEKVIRDALKSGGTCTDFVSIISYPNNTTQIPSQYSFTYTLNGQVIVDAFENVNPDEVNESLPENNDIEIVSVNLQTEIVTLKNNSDSDIDLYNYKLVSTVGNQTYYIPTYILKSGETVTIASGRSTGILKWTGAYIWNNDGDPAELYDNTGLLIDSY